MPKAAYAILVSAALLVAAAAVLPAPVPHADRILRPPSGSAVFGTDALGRDVCYRTVLGFGYTFGQAAIVLGASLLIGLIAAVISALKFQRWPDRLIVVFAESLRSYPALLLVLMFAAVGAPPIYLLILYFWIPIWRSFRFELTSQQREPYVLWMRLMGRSGPLVLLTEVFPNVLPRTMPYVVGLLSEVIAAQAAIEFLGFGPDIEQPSLGRILLESGQVGVSASWVWMPSLLVLVITALSVTWVVRRYRRAIKWVPIG